MNSVFQKLYNQLNPRQKEAVDMLEGPVMVAAGPGTGKTQVLTLRIANILLKEKARPEEILALTFTENGASEMRKRLLEILGPSAYYIPIHTFHAFCNELIQGNPDIFPQFFEKEVVDEISQIEALEGIIKSGDFKQLAPFGDNFMYVVPMLRTFSEIKREGIGPRKFKKFVEEEKEQFQNIGDLYHESGAHRGKMKAVYRDWERNIQKNLELARAFASYQEKLSEVGYDYDDIILSVVERLEGDRAFLQKLQEQYKYLLTDEHQDTNQAQNRVLELLCAHQTKPNIFVVGDEKQSIYRFQGANLSNFLYFHNRYSSVKVIALRDNYRSTQSILDAAGALSEKNSQKLSDVIGGIEQPLRAKRNYPEEKIHTYNFDTPDAERYFISKKVKELIKSGVAAGEIAVLYRDNKEAFPIRDVFEKTKLPYRIESDQKLLENDDVRGLVLILQAVSNFGKDEYLARILHIDFLKIPPLDVYKFLSNFQRSLYDAMRSKSYMRTLGVSKRVRLFNLYTKLSSWNKLAQNRSAPQVYEKIVRESGFLDHILKCGDYIEGTARARSLIHLLRRLAHGKTNYTLGDFIRHLEMIEARGVLLREKRAFTKQNAVRLMTAHRAKGLEFDYVFIVGAVQGHWGRRRVRNLLKLPTGIYRGDISTPSLSSRAPAGSPLLRGDPERPAQGLTPRSSSAKGVGNHARSGVETRSGVISHPGTGIDKEDDERRLFYVALTRARKQVFVSHPNTREDGRELLPSQFIEEIEDSHRKAGDSKSYQKALDKKPEILFSKRRDVRVREDEKEFFRGIFEKRGLSPTALNNYLECPWKYFYNNLLQIPRAKTKHEMYGTAVHAALRDLFDKLSGSDPDSYGGPTPIVYLLEYFERALEREPISEHEFQESLAKGKEALSKYYKNYNSNWHTDTVNEFAVKNVFLDGEVRLTGKIDKIELYAPNVGGPTPHIRGEVNVVDYKTGRRRTRNELEGKTKNATGNEKRQLVFYKLLLDKMPDSPYNMASGEIDFIEPDKRTGKLYKEKFVISEDDVRELEYKIQDVTTEILGFSFWNERCETRYRMVPGEDSSCEYCKLREMMP